MREGFVIGVMWTIAMVVAIIITVSEARKPEVRWVSHFANGVFVTGLGLFGVAILLSGGK